MNDNTNIGGYLMKTRVISCLMPVFLLFTSVEPALSQATPPQNSLSSAFPRLEKTWEMEYDGELQDIAVVEETGDIIILTRDQNVFHLYYLNGSGEQLWSVSNSDGNWRALHGLNISDRGETIVVQASNSWMETGQSYIYDNRGDLLFEDVATDGWYFPSPSGEYLTSQTTSNFYPIVIYNRDGSPLPLQVPEELDIERQMYRFVSDREILVYQEVILDNTTFDKAQLLLVTVPGMNIKWRYILDAPLWLIDFHERNCAVTDEYIALQGTSRPGGIFLFSKEDGRLIWQVDEPRANHGLAFINNGEQLVSLSSGKYLYVIDTKNGTVLEDHQLFDWGGIDGIPKFSFANNQLVIFSNYIGVRDEVLFKTDQQVQGMYSTVINMNTDKKVVQKSFMPYPLKLYAPSAVDSNAYLIGRADNNERRLEKAMILREEE